MKTRNNFVSNSSSSSFVLVGFHINELEKEFLEKIEKDYEDGLHDFAEKNGMDYYSEEEIIGYSLTESNEDGMSESELNIASLIDKAEKLSEIFKISTLKIKLITGEKAC